MWTSVEILVPGEAAKQRVVAALGPVRSVIRFAPSSPKPQGQLLVALDSDLSTDALRVLIEGTSKHVPFVLLPPLSGLTPALAQHFVHWATRRAQEPVIATSPEVLRRLVRARKNNATKQLIATASIQGSHLVVWSCEPKRYEVPLAEIPALARLSTKALPAFAVSSSGSRIHWEDGDVDINLDTIRELGDPGVREAHQRRAREEAARYARAIRQFREEKGLRQSDIEGLTERQVRRIEAGESVPQIDSLQRLAAAHAMTANEYLAALARRSSRSPRVSRR